MKSLIRYFIEDRYSRLIEVVNLAIIYKGERYFISSKNNLNLDLIPYKINISKKVDSEPMEVESLDIYVCVGYGLGLGW